MYLKSLTLKGFKSFAHPTTFAFEQGVTCVVGPNGSGKSNVVDALAWVMGEQGVKTLRGGKMEDVIFAGTSTRGPLGRAEVTLTIDNSDGALPIEYTEVTISRTLFRNGGSEYAINGDTCRLLDVQELLSDSGLGREMHVIVGQGQLDAVLRATPEERRGFIEEAAGILKHRRRKEKTLRKLEAMQTNLTRLSDLAGEIRRQLKPLGRQAEIAREAQTIAAVVRDARARILADDVVGLRRSLDEHNRSESERHSERLVLQEQLEQAESRIRRIEQTQLGDAVDDARRITFELESVQERLRNLYTLANQRLALLGPATDEVAAEPRITRQMVADATAEIDGLRAAVVEAELALRQAQATTAEQRAALDAVDVEIAAQSALVSRHDLELSKLAGAVDAASSKLAAVRGEALRQQNAIDAAVLRLDAARLEVEALGDDPTLADAADSGLDDAYEAAQRGATAAEGEIERLREQLHALERERDSLGAKTSALSRALDLKTGSAELAGSGLDGIDGIVADRVQVRPGHEAAVAAALGTLAEAAVAVDRHAARRALDHAADRELGRVEIVIADGTREVPDAPAGFTSAAELVDAPPGVLGILATVLVVDSLDEAIDAYDRFGSALTAFTIVTRDGAVVTDSIVRGGSGGAQSRIELLAERDAAADRHGEVESLIERARFALGEQRTILQEAKQTAQAALNALREFDANRASQAERVNRVTVRYESAQAEHDRLLAAAANADAAVADAVVAADRAKQDHDTARARPRPLLDVTVRDALSAELDAAREAEVQHRLLLETARERVRAEELAVANLERQRQADEAAAEEAARRAVIRARQAAAATAVTEALPPVLDSVDRSVTEARVALAEAEATRSSRNAELVRLRGEEHTLRQRLQVVTESVHGLELQIYEKKLHLSGLLERAGSELGLVEDILVAEYGPDVPVPVDPPTPRATARTAPEPEDAGAAAASGEATDAPADAAAEASPAGETSELDAPAVPTTPYVRAEQQKRLAAAERTYAQLGRVNPLALEEFAALEQRHRFLTEQLADLTSTRADLLSIIEDIDGKMEVIFASAFADTEAAFTEVFPILFPGGTGSISLTDPDHMLTTGIEVSVKPAGKKIERLSLLSGGERSLAAVALLIAIFKARPSPFYIMDEVEAALDDANLGRLLTIFEDLRQTSQLIVITHQKRTMEIADALYGVSMRQDGVSAVVGQRVAEERAG
ncbi:chromosome segregation protein SMC [Plantibacter sp. Leaf171]|uniref:chromosome segregation SMC family protein n=1 Tax=unclassified Plantibacter TaxID=2624265 RepID=UPI0006FAB1C8|nr:MULTISPECIES: AAA family ATPase [unclassified Plantibacter]KQM15448.1 chromosome segregation protein SMC [Plantibacter sp. Leaf1]KQR58592.1 chromosome segregation protein SMC [Plantibacter sp. Leaf171]